MIAKLATHMRGFTLLETLVAVLILATSIAGPLSIASRSLTNSLVAKDQITAFSLAQDAVEYVRFVRDSNRLKNADWLTGIGTEAGIDLTPCTDANGCYVDSTMAEPAGQGYGEVPTVCNTTCPTLYYNSVLARYTYNTTASGATRTIFTRRILLTSLTATEYRLTVTVSWMDVGNVVRQVNVFENIYKWQ